MKARKPKSVKKPTAGKATNAARRKPKPRIRVPKEKIAGAFAGMRGEAAGILQSRDRFQALVKEALKKAGTASEQFGETWELLMAMLRMSKAYLAGQYEAPVRTIAAIIATLLYWLNPWDLIPDFILMAGYIDDLAVVKFSLGFIADDLKKFIRWEKKQASR